MITAFPPVLVERHCRGRVLDGPADQASVLLKLPHVNHFASTSISVEICVCVTGCLV